MMPSPTERPATQILTDFLNLIRTTLRRARGINDDRVVVLEWVVEKLDELKARHGWNEAVKQKMAEVCWQMREVASDPNSVQVANPTPEEYAAGLAFAQSRWDEAERIRRAGGDPENTGYTIPTVKGF
jgi:hypothetical protein